MRQIAVVGGGIGGLSAAALLARDGHAVTLYEGKAELGGMGGSENHNGHIWNWGGHALYRGGPGAAVLRELGIKPQGFVVRGAPYMEALYNGAIVPAPFSPRTAFSPLLTRKDRIAMLRALAAARHSTGLEAVSLAHWLDEHAATSKARELLLALVRLSSFTHDPARQSAAAALTQLLIATKGVWYLDHGWQQIVDALRLAAVNAGVRINAAESVSAVVHDERVEALRLASGETVAVDAAVVAVGGPRAASKVLEGPAARTVSGWADRAVPVRAATWELSLRRMPPGVHDWVLGIDQPVYINVHSQFARHIAPPGAATVHVLRYLGPDEPSRAHREQMEQALDLAIPGWRAEVTEQRFLPALTVTHDMPTAANGSLPGRPGPLVNGVQGLAVVGDWVGPRGLLAHAALAATAGVRKAFRSPAIASASSSKVRT